MNNIDCLRKKPVKEILEASVLSGVQNAARMWAPQNDAKTGVFPNAAERKFIQVASLWNLFMFLIPKANSTY
jgi:hypothetical protein